MDGGIIRELDSWKLFFPEVSPLEVFSEIVDNHPIMIFHHSITLWMSNAREYMVEAESFLEGLHDLVVELEPLVRDQSVEATMNCNPVLIEFYGGVQCRFVF